MNATEKVINDLNVAKHILCNPQMLTPEMCVRIGQAITSALAMLKEQEAVVRCKDCKHWNAEDHDCNDKVGWFACGADYFCADGERK